MLPLLELLLYFRLTHIAYSSFLLVRACNLTSFRLETVLYLNRRVRTERFVNRGDIVRPWSHGAGSECSVLIHYSHNLHSLFSYSVDLVLVDHGHMRLGYELSNGSTVLH